MVYVVGHTIVQQRISHTTSMPIVFAFNNVVETFTLATTQDYCGSVWKGMFILCTPNASTKGAKSSNIVLEGSSLIIHSTLSL